MGMADLAHYITDYGYWALFIGCLAEGETITLLGGIAAHQGLLHLPWVIAVVALGKERSRKVLRSSESFPTSFSIRISGVSLFASTTAIPANHSHGIPGVTVPPGQFPQLP